MHTCSAVLVPWKAYPGAVITVALMNETLGKQPGDRLEAIGFRCGPLERHDFTGAMRTTSRHTDARIPEGTRRGLDRPLLARSLVVDQPV